MTIKKTGLFLSLFLLSPLRVRAAEPLTWEECVALAQMKNPDLLAAQLAVESRRAKVHETTNQIFPHLSLSSSYLTSKNSNSNSRWNANGTASWDLFDQSIFANLKTSDANLKAAEANLKLISSNVLFNLRKAFVSLLFAQEQIEVAKNIKEIRERNAQMITLRYNSGRESKGNKLRANAEFRQAEVDMNQAARDLKVTQHELNHQLGEDRFSWINATGTWSTTVLSTQDPTFDDLVNQQPNVLNELANIELAKASLKQAKSSLWPTLTATYARTFQDDTFFPGNPNWSAGGTLRIPLLAGGPTASYYAVSGAKRSMEQAEQNLRSTRNQVRSDLESSWYNYQSAQEQVTVQEAFLESSRQQNGEADVRYANGLMTYENWEGIVTDRVNFEKSLIRAKRDAVINEAGWQKTVGKGLGE